MPLVMSCILILPSGLGGRSKEWGDVVAFDSGEVEELPVVVGAEVSLHPATIVPPNIRVHKNRKYLPPNM
jgi:hypothetical protein